MACFWEFWTERLDRGQPWTILVATTVATNRLWPPRGTMGEGFMANWTRKDCAKCGRPILLYSGQHLFSGHMIVIEQKGQSHVTALLCPGCHRAICIPQRLKLYSKSSGRSQSPVFPFAVAYRHQIFRLPTTAGSFAQTPCARPRTNDPVRSLRLNDAQHGSRERLAANAWPALEVRGGRARARGAWDISIELRNEKVITMSKTYVGRCPSAQCSGGTANSAFPLKHPEHYGIPPEILKAVPDDDQICYCNWCKLVWQQPKVAKLGVEAMPLGYTEEEAAGSRYSSKTIGYRFEIGSLFSKAPCNIAWPTALVETRRSDRF
jgi:hypothetical protein